MEIKLLISLYVINLLSALITLWLAYLYLKYAKIRRYILPKNLRLFLITSFVSCSIIQAITTIIFALHYIIWRDEDNLIFKSLRFIQSIASQHVRGSLFVLVIERLVATIFIGKYHTKSNGWLLFWILTLVTLALTGLHTLMTIGWIFIPFYGELYFYVVLMATLIHFLTLIVAKILHSQNQKMYKLLAYRVPLQTRYQIFENIKVLKLLWPIIFVFTLMAPIGVVASLVYTVVLKEAAPSVLFFLTYMPSFITVLAYKLKRVARLRKIGSYSKKETILVIGVLGRRLPTSQSTEMYFEELQKQWNS